MMPMHTPASRGVSTKARLTDVMTPPPPPVSRLTPSCARSRPTGAASAACSYVPEPMTPMVIAETDVIAMQFYANHGGRGGPRPPRFQLSLVIPLQRPDPDIPEAHRIAVILQRQRAPGGLGSIRVDFLVSRRSPERRRVVDQHAIVQHGHHGRLVERVRLETRSGEHDIVGLPFTGRPRRVDH